MELDAYLQVKSSIKSLFGINLDHYKDEQMRRRLDSWLVRNGQASWTDYFTKIKNDPDELSKFRNYLTINVTEFFRDSERWNYLKRNILPKLISDAPKLRPGKIGLRMWSAGCSIGPEPYSVAMIMDELAPGKYHYLLGTDLDRGALQKAQNGGPYIVEDLKSIPPQMKEKYFKTGGPPYYVNDSLIKKVTFREQNMITDTFENDFDLIICRNVVIYFTATTKDMLYLKFAQALRKGGILFIGGTEIIPHPQDFGLKGCGISFYEKV